MSDNNIVIVPHNDGPYEVRGKDKIVTEGGRVIEPESDANEAWLCRCGQSKNKPFCDGTHEVVGFKSNLDAPAPKPADARV